MDLQGPDKIKVRGFIGIELIGRNYIWTRMNKRQAGPLQSDLPARQSPAGASSKRQIPGVRGTESPDPFNN